MDLVSQYSSLLEAAPDAMVIVDGSGRIVLINHQAEAAFGYDRDELLGTSVDLLVPDAVRPVHPRHREVYARHPATRPMGAGLRLEAQRRDGSTFPAEISLSSVATETGDLLVCAAIRDVTEYRRAEHEARAARTEAERANRAKSEFLSRMSHELRTPLNAILGFAQLLEINNPRPEQADQVGYILSGGRHLLALIDEVLDISRIEAGRLELTLEPVPVGEIVQETVELIAPLAQQSQVRFRVDAEASWQTAVLADRQRLKQVLLNLGSNGVKYNRPEGEVRISWRTSADGVRIDVEDTGVGIRDEDMARLFVPFERLGGADNHAEGTGLGLALSKGLVDNMHGQMGATSRYGHGTTFWVSLTEAPAAAPATTSSPRQLAAMPAERRARVLYVEDDLSNLRLVEHILTTRPGIELVPTLQGSMALDLAKQHQPDLVLLDLNLPDLSGDEVSARLRSDPATAAIPVVVVSADALPKRIEALLAQGARDYLTKPLDVVRFLETIDRVLQHAPDRVPPAG